MNTKLKQKYLNIIQSKNKLELTIYTLIDEKEELNFIIQTILEKYNKIDLLSTIYTSLKELILNGVKANIKRLFFTELNLELNDAKDYEKGMRLFKESLSENWIKSFDKKIKKESLFVKLIIWHNSYRFKIKVVNNIALTDNEDKRIREKFKRASQYDSLADFYLDTQDNTEGAGMGITLILMMLKAENLDTHLFTIYIDKQKHTTAKLIFPFSEDYKLVREKYSRA